MLKQRDPDSLARITERIVHTKSGGPAPPDSVGPAIHLRIDALHILLILLSGALARIPFHKAYEAIWSGDSSGYADFYLCLTRHVFYLGERTPVYPLFLGLAQFIIAGSPQPYFDWNVCHLVVMLQSALGVLSALLVFYVMRILQVRTSIALGAALFLATAPGVCFFEMNILNMALSFSLMAVTTALFFATVKRIDASQSFAVPALCTAAAMSLAVLNRPDLLIFAILLVTTMVAAVVRCRFRGYTFFARGLRRATLFIAAPVAIAVLGWMMLMYVGIGQFRITTLDGWNRSRTVYNLFDRVAPADHAIGSIMTQTYSR